MARLVKISYSVLLVEGFGIWGVVIVSNDTVLESGTGYFGFGSCMVANFIQC